MSREEHRPADRRQRWCLEGGDTVLPDDASIVGVGIAADSEYPVANIDQTAQAVLRHQKLLHRIERAIAERARNGNSQSRGVGELPGRGGGMLELAVIDEEIRPVEDGGNARGYLLEGRTENEPGHDAQVGLLAQLRDQIGITGDPAGA